VIGLLLKNLLFTFVVPGTVAVYVPLALAAGRAPASGGGWVAGIGLIALGGAIYAWCVFDFATFGRGTPAPIDAPKRLVVRGLYRYTRNPMYLGVLTLVLGQAVLFRAPDLVAYAIAVATAFQLFVVAYEEPHLQDEFGEEYAAYRARVPRWLPLRGSGSRSGGQ
jgi:protein-S-isoprenylcysteine O-methyltransferase Ste14